MSYPYGSWKPKLTVAQRRAKAARAAAKSNKSGTGMQPVIVAGRTIARSFWGKGWCTHLEKFSDFENRLPRGRTYLRGGAVYHLAIESGRVEARVMGSSDYSVSVDIGALRPAAWKAITEKCSGEIGSLLELLEGKLSSRVMALVAERDTGLFPKPGEMKFSCSCPDWADMCKHVAAVLYGVGSRLDDEPELLFRLRGVDAAELIASGLGVPNTTAGPAVDRLADAQLGSIFGIDLDEAEASTPAAAPKKLRKPAAQSTAPARKAVPGKLARPPEFRATAKTIARLRKKLGLSAAQFAGRLGVSPASVQRWETSSGPLKLQSRCLASLALLHRQAAVA